MKQKINRTLALSLTLLVMMALSMAATVAAAQSPTDLCGLPLRGAIGGIDATATPNYSGYGGYPYGYYGGYMGGSGPYGEEQYYTPQPTPTATPVPQPVNPVNKSCEFGKVLIAVTTERHGTYRVGDVIVVDVYISTSADVQINFDNLLKQNLLVFGASDFELVPSPTVQTAEADGRIQHHLKLRVRSFALKPILWLTVDLLYASELGPENAPIWKRLTTPQLMITTTSTLDHGEQPLEGDIQPRTSGQPWLANVLLALGAILSTSAILLLVVPYILRSINRPRPLSPDQAAWRQFDEAIERGKMHGFRRHDYAQIAAALRARLEREPATLREIAIVSNGDARLNDIASALTKLDRIIFAPEGQELTLNDKELEQLERELLRIVPRSIRQ